MRVRLAIAGATVACLLTVAASSASALTLGTTAAPAGASAGPCQKGGLIVQKAAEPAYDYTVPSGGGAITSWSVNTLDSTGGTPVTLAVLQPDGSKYTVEAISSEQLASKLPAGGIETFQLASPIEVAGGDVLSLTSTGLLVCDWDGGSLTSADVAALVGLGGAETPSVGASYETGEEGTPVILSVSAELSQSQDDGVTGAAMPSTITAGGIAEYAFSVSNAGPGNGPITFSDAVPGGLTILSAVAGSGACTVTGQTVSCTIGGLQPGSSAPVLIIVSAASAGSYADAASVSSTLPDPNPANNSASATLTVNPPPVLAPPCKTVKLTGVTLPIAKLVIPALNCKVGEIKHATSKTVHKGLVISTSPGPGKTLTAGATVSVTISSGRPKPKKKKQG
jgi:uncharacterized repeat protein (TIGR01451 family)